MSKFVSMEQLNEALNNVVNEMQEVADALESAELIGDNVIYHNLMGGIAALATFRKKLINEGVITSQKEFTASIQMGRVKLDLVEINDIQDDILRGGKF